MKRKSISQKLSLAGVCVSLVAFIVFCIYGLVYDYMDSMVALSFLLSAASAGGYVFWNHRASEFLNLLGVICVSWGMGLFFLNSYPVWADRLNGIDMYGSRGTLVPVVAIILLCLIAAVLEIGSCFTRKEAV